MVSTMFYKFLGKYKSVNPSSHTLTSGTNNRKKKSESLPPSVEDLAIFLFLDHSTDSQICFSIIGVLYINYR